MLWIAVPLLGSVYMHFNSSCKCKCFSLPSYNTFTYIACLCAHCQDQQMIVGIADVAPAASSICHAQGLLSIPCRQKSNDCFPLGCCLLDAPTAQHWLLAASFYVAREDLHSEYPLSADSARKFCSSRCLPGCSSASCRGCLEWLQRHHYGIWADRSRKDLHTVKHSARRHRDDSPSSSRGVRTYRQGCDQRIHSVHVLHPDLHGNDTGRVAI